MKGDLWEFTKYAFKVNLKHLPRLLIAPLVGALRGTWQAYERMDAEIDQFDATRKRQGRTAAS